uniref:Carboxylic ester hydrolase n=1 Tax=Panagrolaimus sp. ES5 TaxID=591445 RepID=A0AC34FH62_9BILA
MFFIYGGSFIVGDTKTYGYKIISDNIVSQGIIVENCFFSTDNDPNFSGNLGLWDQLEALKFINTVIHDFGGDKNRITIVGQSAGAASVSLLSLNEEANDLFSQSISMSGSAFSQWATKNNISEIALKVAEKLGCDLNGPPKIKECLKSKNITDFQAAILPYIQFSDPVDLNPVPIGPKLDGDFIKARTLEEALQKAPKKPSLIGVCSQENVLYALSMPGSTTPPGKYFGHLPESVSNYSKTNLEEFVTVVLAKEKYFGKNVDAFVKEVMSDVHFNIPALREAILKAKNQYPTYFYLFDYNIDSSDNSSKYVQGSAHIEDVVTLFGSLYKEVKIDKNGKKVQKQFAELIENFVKTGIPSMGTINVPRIIPNSFKYIQINKKPSIKADLWKHRLEFWNNIGNKYGFDLASGEQIKNNSFKQEL